MKTYQEYQVQIAELQKLADAARAKETAAAREKIAAIMREHGLKYADLSTPAIVKGEKARTSVPAKYRDSASGKTWSGRGRAPKWLNGKERETYLIK
jgi:DNA-binding protein H-NS